MIVLTGVCLYNAVEPFNFTCKSGFRNEQLMISDCQSNNEVLSVDCLLKKNGKIMTKCRSTSACDHVTILHDHMTIVHGHMTHLHDHMTLLI